MGLLDDVIKFSDKTDMLPHGGIVIAAVSGGADSMCLLDVLSALASKYGYSVHAAHFNHCLRGEESDGDQRFVSEYCAKAGIICHIGRGDVSAYAAESRLGTEEAARELRYSFLKKVCEESGAACVATAHTANDNTETVLLNLIRGSGLRGMCGIPPVRDIYVRPLLQITRGQIEAYLAERNIPHREDSTNSAEIYSRNRIRHSVVPVLADINPEVHRHVSDMTTSLREDENYINSLAEGFLSSQADGFISASALCSLPRPVAFRVIRNICGNGLSRKNADDVLRLCLSGNPSMVIHLPKISVYREYDKVFFSHRPYDKSFIPFTIAAGSSVENDALGLKFSCEICDYSENINKSFTTFLLNYDEIGDNVIIRPRITGDSIKLSPAGGTKTLKKLFIEKHVPALKRAFVPVIADKSGPVAVYGMGADVRAWSKPGHPVLKVKIEEIM